MRNTILFVIISTLFISCGTTGTIVDREITHLDRQNMKVISRVSVDFYTSGWSASSSDIKEKAYTRLLGEARKKYYSEMEIKNIVIHSKYSFWSFTPLIISGGGFILASTYQGKVQTGSHYAMGRIIYDYHDYKDGWKLGVGLTGGVAGLLAYEFMGFGIYHIQASADVVIIDYSVPIEKRVEAALNRGFVDLVKGMPNNSRIAIINIQSSDSSLSQQVITGLEYRLVNSGKFKIVERREIDLILGEQNFQSSDYVDDKSAVSFGKLLGASIVITGNIIKSGTLQQLTVKAIDVQTAQILAMAREDIQ